MFREFGQLGWGLGSIGCSGSLGSLRITDFQVVA